MAQALYSKYRPKVFADVVGQQHILQTIQNAISTDKISHAYMFCGPRGTGKTTMARLLAKACICQSAKDKKSPSLEFCGKCEDCNDIANGVHPDVYELDAASRTSVENVREEIISRVGYAATRGTKKIYIIDEVHMLSTSAFNALLKTLEEPPEHVIFILCTTDPHKVPDTIMSRCQRFDFSSISATDIFNRLKYVCEQENVKAEDEALRSIAQNAQGAMRNALTNLEQLIAYTSGEITDSNVADSVASDSVADFDSLIEGLGMKDLPSVFEWVDREANNGADFTKITKSLISLVRNMYVKSAGSESATLPDYIEAHLGLFNTDTLHRIMLVLSDLENELKTSTNTRLSFEISMAKIANPKSDLSIEGLAERISNLEIVASAGDLSNSVPAPESPAHAKEPELEPEVEDQPEFDLEPAQVSQAEQPQIQEQVEESEPESVPEIKAPERPKATNFSEERKNLKQEANIESPQDNKPTNLSSNTELQKLWHTAFSNIRKKYPAFGATLITATPSFNDITKQFILTFPASASFNVGVLKKPDSLEKLEMEIKHVMGDDVGFNIEIDENLKDGFEPKFENSFRGEKAQEEEDPFGQADSSSFGESNTSTESDPITDILNNYGAYNITEE